MRATRSGADGLCGLHGRGSDGTVGIPGILGLRNFCGTGLLHDGTSASLDFRFTRLLVPRD
ncbi:hypothetical protein SAM23877_1732 [Streptomyces ambofaciens ATCC 23877]|uniref:Uncharacterized protein n=1 Tax=Streptomyces ambofaciens (strain ATCC 23877 / 3486 / DSM 40053 / JCM 4204 / NBRC 12836 / NRRL B-2516) TaxID=278992 RepID=A0A0K2APE0_STRA7|nr:hypothetical protein SAM23877_1732 [Streptomyces ambofaciens ATCC 23877]